MPRETGSNNVDYRISGVPLSPVEQQDTPRWSRSSRTTRSKNPSFRTSSRRRGSTISARNRRISSLSWTTQRKKHGQHSSILARWLSDYKYRKSLSDTGWTEQDIMLFVWQNCFGKSFTRRDKIWENSKFRTLDSKIDTYSASQNAPHRCFTHATRVAQVVCFGKSKVVCHPSVMSHMLPHLPQNTSTSDHILPHCPVPPPILDWVVKPCETPGCESSSGHPRSTERQKESPLSYIDGRNQHFRSGKVKSFSEVTLWKTAMQSLLNRARLKWPQQK